MTILRPPRTKRIAEKVKARLGVGASSVIIAAVDNNPSLHRMQFQSAFRQAPRQVRLERRRCGIGPTMHDGIISVTLEGLVRMPSTHPYVEGIVHKQIGEHRTDDRPLCKESHYAK